ncbi:MAG: DHA2 family efflux MFS transporter permease subunit [Pontixanthobacter sp.]
MATAANPEATSLPQLDVPAVLVRHRGLLTVAVMLATIMQILDTTIANVAIPHMQSSLGATFDTVTWVLTSYIIASAIAIPTTGWLADRIGQRQLFLISVGGFVAASMACGAAVNLEEMVLFRFTQGLFAAFIGPLSQAVMLDINPPSRHGRAMAIWGMGIMLGPISGPILGGWLTESYSWRWVFYVNVPIGIITVALLWALLPHRPKRNRRFDLFGFAMLAITLAALQLLLDRGAGEDWFNSTEIWIESAVCISAFWLFVIHMVTGKNPLFEGELLTDRNFLTGLIFMAVIGLIMFASSAILPPMLQRLFGYPVIDTGMLLAIRGLGTLVSIAVAGRLVAMLDMRIIVGTGLIIAAYSFWQMAHWSLAIDSNAIIVSGFIQGLGMGLVFIPLNMIAFATLAPRHRTDGASLLNLMRSLGASIGISIGTTLLGRNTQVSHADIGQHITANSLDILDPSTLDRLGTLGASALQIVDGEVMRQALMVAYIDDFWFMMWVTVLAAPLVMLLRPAAKNSEPIHLGE